jgi:hypothetical protein
MKKNTDPKKEDPIDSGKNSKRDIRRTNSAEADRSNRGSKSKVAKLNKNDEKFNISKKKTVQFQKDITNSLSTAS